MSRVGRCNGSRLRRARESVGWWSTGGGVQAHRHWGSVWIRFALPAFHLANITLFVSEQLAMAVEEVAQCAPLPQGGSVLPELPACVCARGCGLRICLSVSCTAANASCGCSLLRKQTTTCTDKGSLVWIVWCPCHLIVLMLLVAHARDPSGALLPVQVSNVDESGLPLWVDAEQPVLGVCVLRLA